MHRIRFELFIGLFAWSWRIPHILQGKADIWHILLEIQIMKPRYILIFLWHIIFYRRRSSDSLSSFIWNLLKFTVKTWMFNIILFLIFKTIFLFKKYYFLYSKLSLKLNFENSNFLIPILHKIFTYSHQKLCQFLLTLLLLLKWDICVH